MSKFSLAWQRAGHGIGPLLAPVLRGRKLKRCSRVVGLAGEVQCRGQPVAPTSPCLISSHGDSYKALSMKPGQ